VAQRAHISPTWYTSLEQGRGGAPSAEVLDRIARALMLTDLEREHLFLLGLGHSPEVRYKKDEGATPRLQRVLDALNPSPALIRTATWDVVAWNRAATVFLMDYDSLPANQRNILRFIFLDPSVRASHGEKWLSVARFVAASFRADVTRAGAAAEVKPLVDELCHLSPEFRSLWRDTEVLAAGEVVKHVTHPILGLHHRRPPRPHHGRLQSHHSRRCRQNPLHDRCSLRGRYSQSIRLMMHPFASMTLQIRILSEADAGELFRLRQGALLESPLAFLASPEDDLASSEAAVRALLQPQRESVVFGAHTRELVGMLGLSRANQRKAAHKTRLWGMFVLPPFRRHGVGMQLLDAAIRYARSLDGVASVHLSVSESASAAIHLYERAGFETWGIEPDAVRFEAQSVPERHMRLSLA